LSLVGEDCIFETDGCLIDSSVFPLKYLSTKAIDGMVIKIQSNVDRYFNGKTEESIKQPSVSKIQSSPTKLKTGYQWVELEDGSKAQIKIPEIMK
jgi:hypothetical protein